MDGTALHVASTILAGGLSVSSARSHLLLDRLGEGRLLLARPEGKAKAVEKAVRESLRHRHRQGRVRS
eukprot:3899740-Amphidinium_carterae.1